MDKLDQNFYPNGGFPPIYKKNEKETSKMSDMKYKMKTQPDQLSQSPQSPQSPQIINDEHKSPSKKNISINDIMDRRRTKVPFF